MASCNWAFGCAIALFVITLILVLVLVLGSGPDKEEIVVLPPPTPAAAAAAARAEGNHLKAGKKLEKLEPKHHAGRAINSRAENPIKNKAAKKEEKAMPKRHGGSGSRAEVDSEIKELQSAEEAANLLSSNKPVVVLFYADFCGHCKQMMPDFEQAIAEPGNRTGLVIARVEAGKLKDMPRVSSKIPQISGFPTMVVRKPDGKLETHVGRKDKATIQRLLRSTGTASKSLAEGNKREMIEFESFKDACDALQGDDKVMVMAYADWCGFCKSMKADYEALLDKAPADVRIGRINSDKIPKAMVCDGKRGSIDAINAYPTLMYNDAQSKILKSTGRKTLQELLNMIMSKPKKN